MSYIGNQPPDIGAYDVESFDGGGTSFTLKKSATTPSILLFIDGVRQTPTDAYSVSGVTLTTTGTTPAGTDNVTVMFMGDVVDIGAPSDDTVSTAKIQDDAVTTAKINDDAVTAAKLANSINTEIAANTAKVTNATHTGDVTGATALTIATDAVDIAMLSATGTASSSTFLRGDNAWEAAGGGFNSIQVFTSGGTWPRPSDITKVLIHVIGAGGGGGGGRDSYNYSGNGGAGGGYAVKFLDVSAISSSTITIGTGGTAGSVNVSGGTGGASSWADGTNTITANGGTGGLYGGNNVPEDGGTASGGDINATGGWSSTSDQQTSHTAMSGGGGVQAGSFGGPGGCLYDGAGKAGNGYGMGASGGYVNQAGGAGSGGLVWVQEYK